MRRLLFAICVLAYAYWGVVEAIVAVTVDAILYVLTFVQPQMPDVEFIPMAIAHTIRVKTLLSGVA